MLAPFSSKPPTSTTVAKFPNTVAVDVRVSTVDFRVPSVVVRPSTTATMAAAVCACSWPGSTATDFSHTHTHIHHTSAHHHQQQQPTTQHTNHNTNTQNKTQKHKKNKKTKNTKTQKHQKAKNTKTKPNEDEDEIRVPYSASKMPNVKRKLSWSNVQMLHCCLLSSVFPLSVFSFCNLRFLRFCDCIDFSHFLIF